MPEHELDVYHAYVYGVVPPDGLAVRVMDWPLSILGEDGVIAPAARAELTVTVSVAEAAVAAGKAPEVTPVSVTM